jgi:hypothetical protein
MQEAYLIVDFERGNFSLHQAVFPPSNQQKIVAIPAIGVEKHGLSHSLGKGSIAGIVIGGTVFVILVIMLVALLCYRRKRSHTADDPKVELWDSNEQHLATTELPDNKITRMEMMSSEVLELHVSMEEEADSRPRSELP